MKPSPWQQLLLLPTPSLPVSCRRRWTRGSRPSPPPCRATRWRSPPAAIARPLPPHALRRCRPPWLQWRPSPARANGRRTRRNASVCSARRNRRSYFPPPPPLPLPLPPPLSSSSGAVWGRSSLSIHLWSDLCWRCQLTECSSQIVAADTVTERLLQM